MNVRSKIDNITFYIQDCCGAWDRNNDFHFPKCKNHVATVKKGK